MFSLHVGKVTQRCVCCEFEFCVTGRRVCHHRHVAFLSVIENAPLLTKTVKINQSEGIPGSGIPERTFVKNSYKRSRTSLPSPPLLFIALFTLHRSPLFECLEQARYREALVQISLSTEKKRKHLTCMSYFECISVTVSTIYCSNPKLRQCFVQNWVSLYINENVNCCAQLSRSSHYRFTFLCHSFRHL